jgi:beta-N-acetylhexosaminidase
MVKYYIILAFLYFNTIKGQTLLDEYRWVDSVFYTLNTDQKIGQLFMIRAFSKSDKKEIEKINHYISNYHVGGICFFQGTPAKQVELTNQYQSKAKLPLLIGIDGEWGLGMRFPETTIKFPKQITLGAIGNEDLIYEMGKEVANQCKRIGVHMNFAPVVDINNNANNPIINDRSFGEDKYTVSAKATAYMKGLQENGLIATAKHFPGHGDTDVDSHHDLPIINHDLERVFETELIPFKALINQGVYSIMIGHLHLPVLDDSPNRGATLSQKIVTGLLRNQLGFNGLIITDAMEMKGVSSHFPKGIADAEAFLAGNDMILLPEDVIAGINAIKNYINDGKIHPSQLDESVRRILTVKYKSGLFQKKYIAQENLLSDLNNQQALALKSKIAEEAITLVKNDIEQLPLQNGQDYISISIGNLLENTFQKRLSSYAKMKHYFVPKEIPISERDRILQIALQKQSVIVSIHDMSRQPVKNFGITKSSIDFINELNKVSKVILCVFGNPYSLKYFENLPTILQCYEDDELFHEAAAQALFGAISITGTLPVSASPNLYVTKGIIKNHFEILGYTLPERVGLSTKKLNEIDIIADEIIRKKVAPGCVILIAKDNKIVYHKAFGNHTFSPPLTPMAKDDVFDLASLTKILAGTLAIMHLYDEHKISIEGSLSTYIPEVIKTNKENVIISDMLAHCARLLPFIPFYESTVIKDIKRVRLNPSIYSSYLSPGYTVPVAQKMFLRDDYVDTVWQKIFQSELRSSSNYKYSDLGFYMVRKIVENVSGTKFDTYLNQHFYGPLQLMNTCFNPQNKIPMTKMPPSEVDNYWRGQVIQGTVHDMGAAMLGGISGHAGLFSNAEDIAVLMQLLLNGGSYGGKNYLNNTTIEHFTKRHPKSTRRGLGFDMKELNPNEVANMSPIASDRVYGHSGFTGTCAYADPDHNLIYIFLSNRTYPTMDNNALHKNDYRGKIQTLIYEAMER